MLSLQSLTQIQVSGAYIHRSREYTGFIVPMDQKKTGFPPSRMHAHFFILIWGILDCVVVIILWLQNWMTVGSNK